MNTIRIIKTKSPLLPAVKLLIIAAIFVLMAMAMASADTIYFSGTVTNATSILTFSNGKVVPTGPLIAPASPPSNDSTAADWAKALGDLGFHISAAQISLVILIGLPFVKAAAGYLRKAIPKTAQVNQAGIVLAHIAGVDDPTLDSLKAEIPKPTADETKTKV